ncbi:MAG: hypothetical protein ABIP02_02720 [Arenimonas sp.]
MKHILAIAFAALLPASVSLANNAHHPAAVPTIIAVPAVAEKPMEKKEMPVTKIDVMQKNMMKMQDEMHLIMQTKDPVEKKRLMHEHMQSMHAQMKAMNENMMEMCDMMQSGENQVADAKPDPMTSSMIDQHMDMMEKHVKMMQQMLEQMREHHMNAVPMDKK